MDTNGHRAANQDLFGGTCLSKRSIDLVHRLLVPGDHEGRGDRVGERDANALMAFLNTLALSNSLSYDGTLPRSQIDALETTIGELSERCGNRIHIEPIGFSHLDQIHPILSGVAEHIDVQLTKFDLIPVCDQPLVDGHARFREELEKALKRLQDRSGESVTAVSREIAEELFSDNVRFTGSKCIAALACGGPTLLRKALALYARFDEPPRISGALINRFRLMYVGRLAGLSNAIHQPDNTLHVLADHSIGCFIDYLATTLMRKSPGYASGAFWRFFRPEGTPPPVGLLILAKTARSGLPPESVIGEALNFRARYQTLVDHSSALPRLRLLELRNDLVNDIYERELGALDKQLAAWKGHIKLLNHVFIPLKKVLSHRFTNPIVHGLLHGAHHETGADITAEQIEKLLEFAASYFEVQSDMPNDLILQYYDFKREFVVDEGTRKFIAGPVEQLLSRRRH